MIKVRIKTEEGTIIEQEVDKYYLEKWVEDGTLTAENEVWSEDLTGGIWKKVGDLDLMQHQKFIEVKDKFLVTQCPRCGFTGPCKKFGSDFWGCLTLIVLFSFGILPGIIYILWAQDKVVCPICKKIF